jgi:hypothetical protein
MCGVAGGGVGLDGAVRATEAHSSLPNALGDLRGACTGVDGHADEGLPVAERCPYGGCRLRGYARPRQTAPPSLFEVKGLDFLYSSVFVALPGWS